MYTYLTATIYPIQWPELPDGPHTHTVGCSSGTRLLTRSAESGEFPTMMTEIFDNENEEICLTKTMESKYHERGKNTE